MAAPAPFPGLLMSALANVHPALVCAFLLACSNMFMTFAWYGHLKNLAGSPWWIAAIISWGIALFEYLLQVPGNRIGFTVLTLGQLKIMQEVITLLVFVPFAVFYMGQPLKLDFLWAGVCMLGAVLFCLPQLNRAARPHRQPSRQPNPPTGISLPCASCTPCSAAATSIARSPSTPISSA